MPSSSCEQTTAITCPNTLKLSTTTSNTSNTSVIKPLFDQQYIHDSIMRDKFTASDCGKTAGNLDLLHTQLNEAHERAANFRTGVIRLGEERLYEQQELARLIEDLRAQLSMAYSDRNSTQTTCPPSVGESKVKLENLETILQQLLATSNEQENLTCELSDRLKRTEQQMNQLTACIERCRNIVIDCQKKNPVLFNQLGMNPIDTEPSAVVEQLATCIQILSGSNELQQLKLNSMEKQWTSSVLEHQKQLKKLKHEHENQLQEQRDLFHNEMTSTVSRAEAATSEARNLSLQATSLRAGLEEQLRLKTDEVAKLQEEIQLLTAQRQDNNQNEREEALRNVLDKAELEVAKLRCERDATSGQCSALTAKLEAAEAHMKDLDTQLAQSGALQKLLKQKYEKSKREIKKMQTERVVISGAIRKINSLLIEHLELDEEIDAIPSLDTTDWTRSIAEQLNCLVKRLQKKYSMGTQTKRRMKVQGQKLNELMETVAQLKDDQSAKEKVIEETKIKLDQQQADLERVIAERDYYLQVLSEQAEELCTVKAKYQRQLKELEKLGRAKARLDELTSQIQLLKSTPAEHCRDHASGRGKSKSSHSPIRNVSCEQKQTDFAMNKSVYEQPEHVTRGGPIHGSELAVCGISGDQASADRPKSRMMQANSIEDRISPCGVNERLATFVTKLNGLTKAHTLLEVAKNDLEMARSSVFPMTTSSNHDSGTARICAKQSTETAPLGSLKRRLSKLELKMIQAANEKQALETKNEQMAGLLLRLTEQNQKLLKELEDRTTSTNAIPDLGPVTSSTFGLPSLVDLTGTNSTRSTRPQQADIQVDQRNFQPPTKIGANSGGSRTNIGIDGPFEFHQLEHSTNNLIGGTLNESAKFPDTSSTMIGVRKIAEIHDVEYQLKPCASFVSKKIQSEWDKNNWTPNIYTPDYRADPHTTEDSSHEIMRSPGTPMPLLLETETGQQKNQQTTEAHNDSGKVTLAYRNYLHFDYQNKRIKDTGDCERFKVTKSVSEEKPRVLSDHEPIKTSGPCSLPEPPPLSPIQTVDQTISESYTPIPSRNGKLASVNNPELGASGTC